MATDAEKIADERKSKKGSHPGYDYYCTVPHSVFDAQFLAARDYMNELIARAFWPRRR